MFARAALVVVAALAAGTAAALAPPPGGGVAHAAPQAPVIEVTPSTVQTDFLVGIRASCGDDAENTRPATAESTVFGTVTLRPQQGFLTATATVPADQRAGTYRVRLRCPGGRGARTELHVLEAHRPSRGPATGFGGTAGSGPAAFLIAGGLAAILLGVGLGLVTPRRRPAAGAAPDTRG